MLREAGAGHIRVFGGGGGTITAAEAAELEAYGVERIYSPDDGLQLGLAGMIDDLVERAQAAQRADIVVPELARARQRPRRRSDAVRARGRGDRARTTSRCCEGDWSARGAGRPRRRDHRHRRRGQEHRHRRDSGALPRSTSRTLRIAVLAVDPTRRRTGGALLGDRIRMNSLRSERVFMRSMATRRQNLATSAMLDVGGGVPARPGLRPRHRRDGRDRPERLGDRRPRRHPAST